MADATTSQVILNGPQNIVIKWTNVSDGTGETLVKKFDTTAFSPSPGVHLTIRRIDFVVKDMGVILYWEATPNMQILPLAGYESLDYRRIGGLTVPNITGATGSILLSTSGAMPNSSYDITVHLRRNVAP